METDSPYDLSKVHGDFGVGKFKKRKVRRSNENKERKGNRNPYDLSAGDDGFGVGKFKLKKRDE